MDGKRAEGPLEKGGGMAEVELDVLPVESNGPWEMLLTAKLQEETKRQR